MSYILDALKKSELERSQKAEQELPLSNNQTVQPPAKMQHLDESSHSTQPEASRVTRFVYLILVVLSVLVLIKVFETPKESASVPVEEHEANKVVPAANSLVSQSSAIKAENQSTQDSSIINNQRVTNTAINDAVLKQADIKAPAIAIEQAPKEVLNQLPMMNISSHIYSTQANRRSIVVNDQRLVEGDFVSPGVQVQQITNQGMIVQAQGRLLVVSRSRGWGL